MGLFACVGTHVCALWHLELRDSIQDMNKSNCVRENMSRICILECECTCVYRYSTCICIQGSKTKSDLNCTFSCFLWVKTMTYKQQHLYVISNHSTNQPMDYQTNHIWSNVFYTWDVNLETRGDREEVTDSVRREGGERQRGRRERRGDEREGHRTPWLQFWQIHQDFREHTTTHTHTHCVAYM